MIVAERVFGKSFAVRPTQSVGGPSTTYLGPADSLPTGTSIGLGLRAISPKVTFQDLSGEKIEKM